MRIPFLDLSRQYEAIGDEIETAVLRVLRSQRYILGPEVESLEREIAAICGTQHAAGVASGTDALMIALQALGVGPGDEVVTSAFSFFATASSIARLGARPVFADIEPASFNLDPDAVGRVVGRATRAVMPVHIFGQCADVDAIHDAARTAAGRDLPLVEDAAQAIGARRHGRPAGSLSVAGCLSFYPTKNLGGAGDGGMIVTDDEMLDRAARRLRAHGDVGRYEHRELGMNSRLDAVQAAILRAKAAHLGRFNQQRRERAAAYGRLLSGIGGDLVLPSVTPGNEHTWHQYVVRTGGRDALAAHLAGLGIGTAVYYPVPLHLQPCFAALGYAPGDLPHTEAACREVLALPLYPELTDREQQAVAAGIAAFFDGR